MRPCSVDGCVRKHFCKGMCSAHYHQMRRAGRIVPLHARTVAERMEKWTTPEPTTGCLLWLGPTNGKRQRPMMPLHGRKVLATRVVLGLASAPRWLQANHTCNNLHCVNPRHLYIGTAEDNTADMLTAGRGRWQREAE